MHFHLNKKKLEEESTKLFLNKLPKPMLPNFSNYSPVKLLKRKSLRKSQESIQSRMSELEKIKVIQRPKLDATKLAEMHDNEKRILTKAENKKTLRTDKRKPGAAT